jgi:tight adherence protein B
MILILLMFLIGVGAVLGVYALVWYVPGALERRRVNERLQNLSGAPDPVEGEESLVKRAPKGPLPAVDKILAGTKIGSRLVRLIEQAGVSTTPGAIVMTSLVLGAILAFTARIFGQVPVLPPALLPLAAGLLGVAAPTFVLMFKKSRRMGKFEEQFPEALDLLGRALRAGHAFQSAMGMVADDLKEPCGPEFKKTFDQQNYGLPLRDSLFQLAERMPLMDVRFFVTAVLIQRETGGNLAEILDNLAHVVRERFKIRREIRTKTAHGRFTGLVLLALPAGLGVILTIVSPDHMALLFNHRMGHQMIAAAIVMQIVGFFWIRKILDLEV